jgi:hypothetical protein
MVDMMPGYIFTLPWRRSIAVFVVAMLLCVASALARPLAQYQHRAFSAADCAPDEIVTMGQDRDGMMWFGAASGVYTFDGQRFARSGVEFRSGPRPAYFLRGDPAGGSVALLIKRRNFLRMAPYFSNWTDHSCQRRKLVGERHGIDAVNCELALADHVDQLDAGEHRARGTE